ncbi:MAG: serine/threonine-protein kinase [Myxococcota bacterium]|nr:serine/threonine-protein kinase [Myxococcota bacterium]
MSTETVQSRAPAPKKKKKRPPLPIPLGEVLNGYKLIKVVGRGGMGTVYLGEHELLGRKAAVKVLAKSFWNDQEFVSRFFSEAQVATKISNPNIVDILDFIHTENPKRIAYVMELVQGPTLKACIQNHRFSLAQSINVSAQLASALRDAHEAGVIHRDLKPANILVVEPLDSDLSILPSVKLLDFGIAKVTSGQVNHQTMQGTVLGTPKYMAPEQISAEPVSPATDIYALGEIFFEMVTGQRIFNGPNKLVMAHKLSGKIPELECPADIPGSERIIQLTNACLQPDPVKRISIDEFSSMLQLLRENTDIDSSLPITRRRQSWTAEDIPSDSNPSVSAVPVSAAAPNRPNSVTATNAESFSPPQKKRAPIMLIATGVLIAATFIAAYSLLQTPKQQEKTAQPTTRSEPAPATTDKKIISKVIRLTSEPAGASVIDVQRNTRLGTTPYQLEYTDGDIIQLRLTTDGYRPYPIRITEWASEIHYRLTKRANSPTIQPAPVSESKSKTSPMRKKTTAIPGQKEPIRTKNQGMEEPEVEPTRDGDDTSPMNRQDMPSW